MAVLNLRPHTLRYLIVSDGYEDENGDYMKAKVRGQIHQFLAISFRQERLTR